MDGGEDRGHAPNADILVSDKLSKTLQKLDSSIIGRSPVTAERQTGNSIRRPQHCPSWLKMNYSTAEVFDIESQPSDSDRSNIVYSFNCFCWQGCGGQQSAPVLPCDLLTDIKDVKSCPKRPHPWVTVQCIASIMMGGDPDNS